MRGNKERTHHHKRDCQNLAFKRTAMAPYAQIQHDKDGGNVLDYRCRTRVRVLNCEQVGNLARRQAKHRKNNKRAHGISISPHRKKRTTCYCKGKCAQYDTSAQHSNRRHPERINIVMMKEVLRTGAREAPTDASEQRKAETSYVL